MYPVQNNVLSIAIALILYFSLKTQMSRKIYVNKSFFWLLWSTIGLLGLESVIVIFNGVNGDFVYYLLLITAILYFTLTTIVAYLCVLYFELEINQNTFTFKRPYYLFIGLVGAVFIVSILSIRANYLYEINASNVFSYGSYHYIYVVATYGVAVYSILMSVQKARSIRGVEATSLILFIALPTIAVIMQLIFSTYSLVWNAIVVSLVISYIFVQVKVTSTDYLTGLFNKREFQYQLDKVKIGSNKNEKVYGILIDLDDFKLINDAYGHQEGDIALIEVSSILQSSVRRQDFVSRIGGDEFAIILSSQTEEIVNQVIQRIKENLLRFNEDTSYKYNLNFSYGYDFYDEEKFKTVLEFFNHIDSKMYSNKRKEQ